jgi:hypothetical protein
LFGGIVGLLRKNENMIKTYKFTFKIVRSFGLGFEILSPKLNGCCFIIMVGCLRFQFWNRGEYFIGFESYWDISDWLR